VSEMSIILDEVHGCPCGERHLLTAKSASALRDVTAELSATVRITASGGARLVPRLYIACHGLHANDLPVLAERYGFEKEGGQS
jgi:hypothetical protein